MKSDRFTRNFPNGLKAVSQKAKDIQIRFGCWGGPDGFGNTQESAELRKKEMISLCKDYEWALFKFDAVCGQLRTDKVDVLMESGKDAGNIHQISLFLTIVSNWERECLILQLFYGKDKKRILMSLLQTE